LGVGVGSEKPLAQNTQKQTAKQTHEMVMRSRESVDQHEKGVPGGRVSEDMGVRQIDRGVEKRIWGGRSRARDRAQIRPGR
jgi:hypothetical protein